MTSSKRILITGAQGFTGRYLAKELSNGGHEVFGTVFQEKPEKDEYSIVDLSDLEGTSQYVGEVKPDCVVHLAAISTVQHKDKSEIYRVNVDATKNLLRSIRSLDYELDSLVLASSANVYGNSPESISTETDIPNPANDYAKSKLQMESLALEEFGDLRPTITRPFNYTGVGQSEKFLIPKIVEHFAKKKDSIELGDISVIRDFSDVRTVAWVYSKLCFEPAPGQVLNVCSGKGLSVTEVISILEDLTSQNLTVLSDGSLRRDHEVQRLIGNPLKLLTHLGEIKSRDFGETLRWMLDSTRERIVAQ